MPKRSVIIRFKGVGHEHPRIPTTESQRILIKSSSVEIAYPKRFGF